MGITSTIYDSPGAASPGGSWFDIVTTGGAPCEAVAARTGSALKAAIRRAIDYRGADTVVLVMYPPAGFGGAR